MCVAQDTYLVIYTYTTYLLCISYLPTLDCIRVLCYIKAVITNTSLPSYKCHRPFLRLLHFPTIYTICPVSVIPSGTGR